MKRSKVLTLSLIGTLVLSACSTNPFTGQKEMSDTGIGASIGTIVGAGVGLLIGDNGAAAAIGAASGAALGGAVGHYFDKQEAKLRALLEGTGVSVTRYPDRIVLNMPNNLTFNTGSAVLKPFGAETLRSVAAVLKEYKNTAAHIVGYTDSTGAPAYNKQLSEERANSVADALIMQGVSASRIKTYGAGSSHPIASNATEAGRAQNRRVEITLVPL